MIKCKHCGHPLPEGSKFCNQCGAKVTVDNGTMECPNCNSVIPAGSVFCPECGEKIAAAAAAAVAANEINFEKEQPTEEKPAKAAPAREAKKAAVKPSQVSPKKTKLVDPDDDDDDDDDDDYDYETNERHRTRNIIIAIIILALIALFVVTRCMGGGSTKNEASQDSVAAVADNKESEDIMSKILQDELNSSGGAIAYAMRFMATEDNPDHIVGIVYNNRESHWYYRIYDLTKNGNSWAYAMKQQESIEKGTTFDRSRMAADEAQIPQALEIDGKKYFFYAYMKESSSTDPTTITLKLYDPDKGEIVETLAYSGNFTQRDGKQVIVADPKANGQSRREAMETHARLHIGALHIKTPDEIEDEKAKEEEERLKEEEEREKNSTDWEHNNSGAVADMRNGSEVTINMNSEGSKTEPPQDLKGNIAETKQGNTYTVFRTNNGKVYAYNKTTEKYLQVYGGGAKSIAFASSEPGVVYIGTASGKVRVNLNTGRAKVVSDNPDKEQKAEPAKTEGNTTEGSQHN